MGDACRKFNTPVTGGNVSFYNENPKGSVFPTPVIGMLGLIEDLENHRMTPGFKKESDIIYYIGAERKGLGGSEYLHTIHGLTTGDAPEMDLDFEARLQSVLLSAIQKKMINAAHDISDGGLAITLAEMAIFSGKGAKVSVDDLGGNMHEVLYSEAQSGVVVTCREGEGNALEAHLSENEIPFTTLGTVEASENLEVAGLLNLSIGDMCSIYENVIDSAMKKK
jgi:phosphoribosylformylglycinamidine synthase